ncbi:MAG: glycosyltransferase family 4 protein [bacterium]
MAKMPAKKKRLKIATIVTSEIPFPIPKDFPRVYAPLQVALDLAEGLTKKGHEVTFFGPKGSHSKIFKTKEVNFSPLYKNPLLLKDKFIRGIEREKIFNLFDQKLIISILEADLKEKFDIIHIHPVDRALPLAPLFKTPIVYTLHDPVYAWRKEIFEAFQTKNQFFVSISKFQQKPAPNLNWAGTVYNGINIKRFPFGEKSSDFCLFSGRILPKKGTYEAMRATRKAKEKLIIIGSNEDNRYWTKKIKPNLGGKIKYKGLVPYKETFNYYSKAKASLIPILWDEPFGLVYIESMACGTPVITFNRGSAKEIVKNGKTGFIVKDVNGIVQAIKNIDKISRQECRRWVEDNFTVEKMVDGYEKVFYEIISKQKN